MIAKLTHRVRKLQTIGVRRALRAWHNKMKIHRTAIAWQEQKKWMSAISPDAARLLGSDFQQLFIAITRKSFSFMHSLYPSESSAKIINDAHQYAQCRFDVLGSGSRTYEMLPWTVDIRLQRQNAFDDTAFDTKTYFAHMVIQQSPTDVLMKDIKVPWELSRFQYLPVVAKAYVVTGDQRYVDTIITHVSDWIEQNPFLYGPNWVNAMEVAIRAINWIAAFDLVKQALPMVFAKQFMTALYQHMIYIEHNWEYYDSRTNNHYVTNLVGYLYLVHFFADIPGMNTKFDCCVTELMRELDKQVFEEGTGYEGSTQYHKLVTELYYLAYVLLQDKHIIVNPATAAQLQRMISFLVWCTPHKGNLVTIGDHDSGVIMRGGLSYQKLAAIWSVDQDKVLYTTYNAFGLSIIKTDFWHVTLRHHAYHPRQPSGHFHNDVGSVTLSVDGRPIFVDPGSFVYTPSAFWRNYFRSTGVHNSCFIKDIEPVVLNDRLFELDMPAGMSEHTAYQQDDTVYLSMRHQLYKKYGLVAQRDITYDMNAQLLTIADLWLSTIKQHVHTSAWHFTLAPDIVPIQESKDRWLLLYKDIVLVALQSHDLVFAAQPAWVSPSYGVKIESKALYAQSGMAIDKPFVITVRRV